MFCQVESSDLHNRMFRNRRRRQPSVEPFPSRTTYTMRHSMPPQSPSVSRPCVQLDYAQSCARTNELRLVFRSRHRSSNQSHQRIASCAGLAGPQADRRLTPSAEGWSPPHHPRIEALGVRQRGSREIFEHWRSAARRILQITDFLLRDFGFGMDLHRHPQLHANLRSCDVARDVKADLVAATDPCMWLPAWGSIRLPQLPCTPLG
jgi:hypothetical protein